MIHTTEACECPRRYVSRARGSTQEWYKQENLKCRGQVSRIPGAVPYPMEHGRIREHLWSWCGICKDSCCREELAPSPVMGHKEEVGLSCQAADIIYWYSSPAGVGGRRQDKVSAVQLREKLLQPITTIWVQHWRKLLCTLGHPNCMKRLSTEGCQEG